MNAEWSDLAERTEAIVMERFNAETEPGTRTLLGMDTRRIGTGVLTFVHRDPIGYWNKALGFTEPVTDERLVEVVRAADLSACPRSRSGRAPGRGERRSADRADRRRPRAGVLADHAHRLPGRPLGGVGAVVLRPRVLRRRLGDVRRVRRRRAPNPSQHNMRAAGLTEVHVRPNWVYRRQAG
jgi:hypothetical protein